MKKSLSLLTANSLFLLTMLLVITIGSVIQTINLSYGLLATEALLILLPTLLILRWRKVPLKEGLRLNPIRPVTALLCLLLGLSAFLFSVFIDVVMAQLTKMASVPLPANALPNGWLDSSAYFIALAIAAPLCEEILFRGAIQGAYEKQRSPLFAILITGTMFAFYHFRLSGLPALLPVAFILCYVVWCTQSIFAGMLVHFGMNAASAANTLYAIHVNGTGLPVISLWLALVGIVVSAALLYIISRLPVSAPAAPSETAPVEVTPPILPQRSWLKDYWPLFGAGLLYLAVACLTLVTALFPELNASTQVSYFPPRIDVPISSRYQVTDRAGKEVGDMICTITPQEPVFNLECIRHIQAYEVKQANSYFSDVDNTTTWSATWDGKTLDLVNFSFIYKPNTGNGYQVALKDGQLTTTSTDSSDHIVLARPFLLEYEWCWRAGMLKSNPNSVYKTPFAYLLRWNEAQKKSLPALQNELLRVYSSETLTLPAGRFDAWKVTIAGQAAWFTANDPGFPRPIQLDDGMVTYSLTQ